MYIKAKCHILTHIVEDIRRLGPAITLSTETFESFNGVFRLCSVLSNHQAPSRDIAFNMADMARLKHIASGGKWQRKGKWVGPGRNVIKFFSTNDKIQRFLGWQDIRADRIGDLTLSYIMILHLTVRYRIHSYTWQRQREKG